MNEYLTNIRINIFNLVHNCLKNGFISHIYDFITCSCMLSVFLSQTYTLAKKGLN